jgi:hypothetical protein
MHLVVLSYRTKALPRPHLRVVLKFQNKTLKTLRGKTISLCSHKGGWVIKSEIHLPHAIVTCRATQWPTAAVPQCANGLHYQGHAVTLMSYTHREYKNAEQDKKAEGRKFC